MSARAVCDRNSQLKKHLSGEGQEKEQCQCKPQTICVGLNCTKPQIIQDKVGFWNLSGYTSMHCPDCVCKPSMHRKFINDPRKDPAAQCNFRRDLRSAPCDSMNRNACRTNANCQWRGAKLTSSQSSPGHAAFGGRCVPRVTQNISACLMVKEDNHKMVEWIAYHHYTLPLTRVIVCEEQGNKEYVRDQFADSVWKDRVQFEFWVAGVDFYNNSRQKACLQSDISAARSRPTAANQSNLFHRPIQRACYDTCMRRLKATGATWTLFLDTDEYLVAKNSAGGANALQPLLNSCPFSNQSQGQRCHLTPIPLYL